ncbi:MAG: aminotransferase class I/II-fold pyridoxal phosphate-dependent enzyme [Clostridiaceae bacterium]
MINLKRVPLIEGLELYTKEKITKFHMPGHRHEELIEELDYLKENLYNFDVTEVPGTDNLHYPENIIKRSEELLSTAMNAKESLYCINGSTASNYAMIYGLFRENDTVLVQRNCHQSVYNAINLLNLDPKYLMPEIVPGFNILSTVSLDEIKDVYSKNPMAKGIILTSPSYFGIAADIKSIADFCAQEGIYLLVDEAHGAHFSFSSELPESSMVLGAHASSVSFHKTLPSLTQSSVLNLSPKLTESEILRIKYYHRIFQSSSPSYPMMASMEMARYFMEEHGEALYKELIREIRSLKVELSNLEEIHILDKTSGQIDFFDETRLVINTPLDGEHLSRIFREKYQIQSEMTEGRNIVFIVTPFNRGNDLKKLIVALNEILSDEHEINDKRGWNAPEFKDDLDTSYDKETFRNIERVIPEKDVLFMENEAVSLKESIGRISFEKVVPYPPGVPLLLPGERITRETVNTLIKIYQSGSTVNRSISQDDTTIHVVK